MSTHQKRSLWQRISEAMKSPRKNPSNLQVDWMSTLAAYTQRRPEGFIEANIALIERVFPEEKSMAKAGTKAFLLGRDWNPNLGFRAWSTGSGQAFDSGEITGSQQATSILLLALDLLQSRFADRPPSSDQEIQDTFRNPEFQTVLVERGIQAGIKPGVVHRLVKELPDLS